MMSIYLTCFLKLYLSFTIVGICHVLPCMYRFSISAYDSPKLSHLLAIDTNLERLIINNLRYIARFTDWLKCKLFLSIVIEVLLIDLFPFSYLPFLFLFLLNCISFKVEIIEISLYYQ